MASVVWSGELEFGMVSVPIKIVAAARANKQSFRSINPATGAGVKQLAVDASTGEVLDRSSLVKGTDISGRTVLLNKFDMEQLGADDDAGKVLSVSEFVKLDQVDPLFFDSSYYVLPHKDLPMGAYELVRAALTKSKAAAIGKMIRNNREYLVLIRSSDRGLALHTLFYADEVRPDGWTEPCLEVDSEALKLARSYIRARLNPFEPEKYHDEFRERLLELLRNKADAVVEVDLKEQLKESIKNAKSKSKAKSKTSTKKDSK